MGPTFTTRAWLRLAIFGCWMAALSIAYFSVPGWHIPLWLALGVSAAAAVCYGMVRNRARQRLPWLLLATALITLALGDTTYNVLTTYLHQDNPYPSVADLFYLVTYPLIAVGLLRLAHSGSRSRDRAALLDALILTLGIGLLFWIYLILPYTHEPGLTPLRRFVSVAYPLGDILILVTTARLAALARRAPAVALLVIGAGVLLITDACYAYFQLKGTWQVGGPVDIGWIAFNILWGAAALHPSMVALTEPRLSVPGELSRTRLAVLAGASLIAPVVLFIEELRGTIRDARVIAVLSALLFLLVLGRLSGVARTLRGSVARERALRQAAGALVSQTTEAGVGEEAARTVDALVRPGAPHRTVMTIYHHDEDLIGAPTQSDLVERDRLDEATARQLAGFDLVLRAPLTVPGRRTGDPRIGALFVGGAHRTLATLGQVIEVLTGQVALALERIALTADLARRDSEAYFRTLVHHASDVILIVEDEGTIRYASPSAVDLFEVDPRGRELSSLIQVVDGPTVAQSWQMMLSGGSNTVSNWQVRRPDDSVLVLDVSYEDLRHEPTVNGFLITLRDVTRQRRLEGELRHRALHDSLTGLANRVLFTDAVRQALRRIPRTGRMVGMIFVDLDAFKDVNDTRGHQFGDELLVAVARRLTSNLRQHDLAARLGGDEFGVLIDDATTPEEIEAVAERIKKSLDEPFYISGDMVSGTASLGVATSVEASDEEDLRRKADLALYDAKGAGRGQWRRYQSESHTAVLEGMEIRATLDTALTRDQFELHYQPVVVLSTGESVGFEALLRWHHPTKGLIGPSGFITAAEESGLIVPIGGWALHRAVSDLAGWRRDIGDPTGKRLPYVSVNVSARQFRAPGFPDGVLRELADAGLPTDALMLELTESLLLREDEEVWTRLGELRAAGVRMAIDDFGTGYSSLGYLRHMPFDVLKLDRSFITTIVSSRQQYALVDGIVRLADTLRLRVIAEGIEEETERDMLLAMGVGFGQGYLFSRPLNASDTINWIRTQEGIHAGTPPP